MGIFTAGRNALASVFEVNAESILYRQGEVTLELLCKVGKTVFRTDDLASAVSVHIEAVDFIVRYEDLNGISPERGDAVLYAGKTYSVYAPNGEPCWRSHTTDASQIRIHALLDGNVTPFDGQGA